MYYMHDRPGLSHCADTMGTCEEDLAVVEEEASVQGVLSSSLFLAEIMRAACTLSCTNADIVWAGQGQVLVAYPYRLGRYQEVSCSCEFVELS